MHMIYNRRVYLKPVTVTKIIKYVGVGLDLDDLVAINCKDIVECP